MALGATLKAYNIGATIGVVEVSSGTVEVVVGTVGVIGTIGAIVGAATNWARCPKSTRTARRSWRDSKLHWESDRGSDRKSVV